MGLYDAKIRVIVTDDQTKSAALFLCHIGHDL